MGSRLSACIATVVAACAVAVRAEEPDRGQVVRALLERSRLLEDVRFGMPLSLYRDFRRQTAGPRAWEPPAPVPLIAQEGVYQLNVRSGQVSTLSATVRLHVFAPDKCEGLPVLSGDRAWRKVTVNGKPTDLATIGGWLRFSPEAPGDYVLTAEAPLETPAGSDEGSLEAAIPRTARTAVRFDSPEAWEVSVPDGPWTIPGSPDKGTHGELARTPREQLSVSWRRPRPPSRHPPRYQLSGQVAWNIDAGSQQVTARLDVTIVAGRTDRIDLVLPGSAERVSVAGPDVREIQVGAGTAAVFLRGQITGQTRLTVQFEMPVGSDARRSLGALTVRDGSWTGGVLVVGNTAGGSEVLPESLSGLEAMALADVPSEASAISAGPAVMALRITGRQWSADLDVVNLSDFALRESIVDIAHYEVAFRGDGAVMCRCVYEVRNRNRQFLRVELPAGSRVLLARVNEKPCPLTGAPGRADAYLLPLVRSKASVKGLVSFPVEIVLMYRTGSFGDRGQAGIPLPRVDLPIAYAWCEAYVPRALSDRAWAGPMQRVERYSSQTAAAYLGYGSGELAEGYEAAARPTVDAIQDQRQRAAAPKTPPAPATQPAAPQPPPEPLPQAAPVLGRIPQLGRAFTNRAQVRDEQTRPVTTPPPTLLAEPISGGSVVLSGAAQSMLAPNYWRAGQSFYEKGDYANAAENLRSVVNLAPQSVEAENAKRLLSNIDMLSGKLQLKGRSEQAAGAKVRWEIEAKNRPLAEQQQRLLERGLQAAQEGRQQEAQEQFQAAEVLGQELLRQGAAPIEQSARLRTARQELARSQADQGKELADLQKRVDELKAGGDFGTALEVAKDIQKRRGPVVIVSDGTGLVDSSSGQVRQKLTEQQKQVEDLTFLAAREKARKQRQSEHEKQPAEQPEPRAEAVTTQPAAPGGKVPPPDEGEAGTQGELARHGTGRSGENAPVVQVYDTRDLVIRVPNFKGPRIELSQAGPNAGREQGGGLFEEGPADTGRGANEGIDAGLKTRQQLVEDISTLIRETVAPTSQPGDGNGTIAIREVSNQLVITADPKTQKAVADLLAQLREARGPQVQQGANIAKQVAEGLVRQETRSQQDRDGDAGWDDWRGRPQGAREKTYAPGTTGVTDLSGTLNVNAAQPQMLDFLDRNYKWALGRGPQPQRVTGGGAGGGGAAGGGQADGGFAYDPQDLLAKLRSNLGQKVLVSSANADATAGQAEALGVRFQVGNNGVRFGVCDEAQFRTLIQLGARRAAAGPKPYTMGDNRQDTIVGTDALLANGWTANVRFAGDRGNRIDVLDNPIDLPHERYVLIDNGKYLTAVRAGEMQYWTQAAQAEPLVEVPEEINVPRVGRLVKFEKTLVKPTDDLVLRVDYVWEVRGER